MPHKDTHDFVADSGLPRGARESECGNILSAAPKIDPIVVAHRLLQHQLRNEEDKVYAPNLIIT